jgi:hypothetical protein
MAWGRTAPIHVREVQQLEPENRAERRGLHALLRVGRCSRARLLESLAGVELRLPGVRVALGMGCGARCEYGDANENGCGHSADGKAVPGHG